MRTLTSSLLPPHSCPKAAHTLLITAAQHTSQASRISIRAPWNKHQAALACPSHPSLTPSSCLQLNDARDRLAALRAEHREIEGGLRKAKKRAAQDVESVIGEYDMDVGAKEGEYQVGRNFLCRCLYLWSSFSEPT